MKPPWSLALLLTALIAAGCDSPRQELDRHELAVAVKSLNSLAAEAGMLAEELGQHHVTAAFAWSHQQALAQESAKVAEALAKPLPDRLRPIQQQALQLNTQLQTQLLQLAQAAPEPQRLAALKHGLEDLGAQVQSLEDEL